MMMIELTLNGRASQHPEGVTLPALVDALGLPAAMLLIELNGEALLRHEWEGRELKNGDRLEILRVAAGG